MRLPDGYAARAATRSDIDGLADLLRVCDLAITGLEHQTREGIEWGWLSPGFTLEEDSLVIERESELVAFAQLMAHHPSIQTSQYARVHPDHWGRGLGSALADWAEHGAQDKLPRGESSLLRAEVEGADDRAKSLLSGRGYEPIRSFWIMEKRVDEDEDPGRPPSNITIRVVEPPGDYRVIHSVLEEAFRDHFGYEPRTYDEWAAQNLELDSTDPNLMFLAMDGKEAVGGAIDFIDEGVGWVGVLGVLDGWRRRGVGRALLMRSFAELGARGVNEVRLGVDTENETGATHLYKSAGMSVRRVGLAYQKTIERRHDG